MTTTRLSLYFLGVNLVMTIAMAIILIMLDLAFGLEIGGSGPAMGVLIGSIIMASRKFASLEDEPPSPGRYWRLSLGMTAAAVVANLITVAAVGSLIAPDLLSAASASGGTFVFLLIVLGITFVIELAIIRFAFAYFSRREIQVRMAAKINEFE
ncbi:MAG: ABZJ_00895 family protein [Pikeienuella sp.]